MLDASVDFFQHRVTGRDRAQVCLCRKIKSWKPYGVEDMRSDPGWRDKGIECPLREEAETEVLRDQTLRFGSDGT